LGDNDKKRGEHDPSGKFLCSWGSKRSAEKTPQAWISVVFREDIQHTTNLGGGGTQTQKKGSGDAKKKQLNLSETEKHSQEEHEGHEKMYLLHLTAFAGLLDKIRPVPSSSSSQPKPSC